MLLAPFTPLWMRFLLSNYQSKSTTNDIYSVCVCVCAEGVGGLMAKLLQIQTKHKTKCVNSTETSYYQLIRLIDF